MKLRAFFGVAFVIGISPAFAQTPAPPPATVDWHSYALLLEQQRDRESARANNYEVELEVFGAKDAATAKWWSEYVKGLHPTEQSPAESPKAAK